jgi:hypothetical protein
MSNRNISKGSKDEGSNGESSEDDCHFGGSAINNRRLTGMLQDAKDRLPFSVCMGNRVEVAKKMVNYTVSNRFSLDAMGHLASPVFLIYLTINNPKLVNFLKDLMYAIFICNQLNIRWFDYYDDDVNSRISIFIGERYTTYAPPPPYVENIGSLHLEYFYQNWLKYFNRYQKLSWVIYKAAVSKRHGELTEIKNICRKKGLTTSFRDVLLDKSSKKASCISLLFKKDYSLIASFLGHSKDEAIKE